MVAPNSIIGYIIYPQSTVTVLLKLQMRIRPNFRGSFTIEHLNFTDCSIKLAEVSEVMPLAASNCYIL